MPQPAAATSATGLGEGSGVGNACSTGLINSNSINFFSFFVVRFVPVEIEAVIADELLSLPISLEGFAATAACLSHSHFDSP
jgi:hypothetical protein